MTTPGGGNKSFQFCFNFPHFSPSCPQSISVRQTVWWTECLKGVQRVLCVCVSVSGERIYKFSRASRELLQRKSFNYICTHSANLLPLLQLLLVPWPRASLSVCRLYYSSLCHSAQIAPRPRLFTIETVLIQSGISPPRLYLFLLLCLCCCPETFNW